MTDLTEQWKKGELPAGYYYVKNEFNNIFPSDYSESYDSINDAVIKDFFTEVSEITEVIAKVPSYEEWKAADNCMLENEVLRLKNAQLKETNEALEVELKEVCDVLIRKCPEMKEWVMMNWKHLYEVQDE